MAKRTSEIAMKLFGSDKLSDRQRLYAASKCVEEQRIRIVTLEAYQEKVNPLLQRAVQQLTPGCTLQLCIGNVLEEVKAKG